VHVLQKRAGISFVGNCRFSEVTPEQICKTRCDVLLLDSLETEGRQYLVAALNEHAQQTKAILFGMDENPGTFLKAVGLGVRGYLLKNASSAEMIAAIHAVAEGAAICSPKLCMSLFQLVSEDFRQKSGMIDQQGCIKLGLTYRQRELVTLVAKGLTNKEIALALNLSEFTVKNHIHRIMRLVDVGSRHEAVELIRAGGFLLDA
jgi:DNA-binding NarL/FixJ family response regulator